MIAEQLAIYLDGLLAELIYDPAGATGNVFVHYMPEKPDTAVAITPYGGVEPDSGLGYDEYTVQFRVRGDVDPNTADVLIQKLYYQLEGSEHVVLNDGTRMISAIALTPPNSLGEDDLRRFESVVNFRIEVRAVTAHRV